MQQMDAVSEQHLAQVSPVLAAKVRSAASLLSQQEQAIFFRVAQGLRTYQQQDQLFAQGRTLPGPVVTDARGGFSNHNFGCAVDCFPFIHGSSGPIDLEDPEAAEFKTMVAALKKQGLAWGGDWKHPVDCPHFQLANVPITPTAVDRALFAAGGLEAVWKHYGDL